MKGKRERQLTTDDLRLPTFNLRTGYIYVSSRKLQVVGPKSQLAFTRSPVECVVVGRSSGSFLQKRLPG